MKRLTLLFKWVLVILLSTTPLLQIHAQSVIENETENSEHSFSEKLLSDESYINDSYDTDLSDPNNDIENLGESDLPSNDSDEDNFPSEDEIVDEDEEDTESQPRAPDIQLYAAIPEAITSLTLADDQGNPLDYTVNQWDSFRINGEFILPNNVVNAGDTTTITLPPQLEFRYPEDFTLKDDENNDVAYAIIDPSSKTIILTYTDYVENHSNISGNFYFYAGVDSSVVLEDQIIQTSIDVEGQVFPIELDYEEEIDSDIGNPIEKTGWMSDTYIGGIPAIQYRVSLNKDNNTYSNLILSDKIVNEGLTYVEGSFEISAGQWRHNGQYWELENESDVTERYHIELSEDLKQFTINFGDVDQNEHFAVLYKVSVNYPAIDGELFENNATMYSDEVVVDETTAGTYFQQGGGGASGYKYSLSIFKHNSDDQPLSEAVFEVYRQRNSTLVDTITTDTQGTATINGLLKDTYIIREIVAPDGYNLLEEDIVVTPDDFDSEYNAYLKIENTLASTDPVPIQFNVTKQLTGRQLTANEFEFTLTDADGNVLQTVTNDADGKVFFSELNFDQVGTYNYVIAEVNDSQAGVTYDDHLLNVTVTVTDTDGQLQATASYKGETTFTNRYQPKAGAVVLEAAKSLSGKALTAGAFDFTLTDDQGTLLQTVTNDADGKVYFPEIYYDQAGTYNYVIAEVNDSQAGVTYDDHLLNVTVTVTDTDGQLQATASYKGETTFTNRYQPKAGAVVLEAAKSLSGKALTAGAFDFTLTDDQGTLLQTVTNDADGKIYFPEVYYDQAGTYNYVIAEVNDSQAGVTYDDHLINVTVTVTDTDGQLQATASYEGDTTFKNTFKKEKPKGYLPNTGEFDSNKIIILLAVLLLVIGGFILRNAHRSNKKS